MDEAESHRKRAALAAERAHLLLVQPATLDSYDWLLVATLVIEAYGALKNARDADPVVRLPILDTVIEELREATANFSDADFLRATRSARRHNPSLFAPLRQAT
jgi:hypothetical protein